VEEQKLKSRLGKDKSKHEKAKHGKAAKPESTKASARALDIGAGSGYPTSVFYYLVRDGCAMTAEATATMPNRDRARAQAQAQAPAHIPALTALAQRNICTDRLGDALDLQGIVLVTANSVHTSFSLKEGESDLSQFQNVCRVSSEGTIRRHSHPRGGGDDTARACRASMRWIMTIASQHVVTMEETIMGVGSISGLNSLLWRPWQGWAGDAEGSGLGKPPRLRESLFVLA